MEDLSRSTGGDIHLHGEAPHGSSQLGNPRFGSTGLDEDGAFGDVLPPGDIVLEQVLAGGDKRRSGVTPTERPKADLGGMPSSLVRASAVCKQWRCAVTDPKFLRRFRLHHRKPPLLGLFHRRKDDIVFTPIMDRPDRIPPSRFDLHLLDIDSHTMWMVELLDCRHGRVLLMDTLWDEVIMCEPITGEQRRLTVPPEFVRNRFTGAVLCAAIDHDHVHGSCHSSPFNVVLISALGGNNQPIACVYSSETGEWGDIIPSSVSFELFYDHTPGLLVGNALYWLLDSIGHDILKFDLDKQSLAVIRGPPLTNDFRHGSHCIIQAGDCAIGFAILSYPHLQMWQRNINFHGVATWVLWKTIDMRMIIGLPKQIQGKRTLMRRILGYLEDSDEILLSVGRGAYKEHSLLADVMEMMHATQGKKIF
uniref:F-box protein AT5G49610-like beta-propeller domain-containing protein n=1 Tax=Aegilops tauschii TaxID=37682 RepID=N1QUF8_AEGTA